MNEQEIYGAVLRFFEKQGKVIPKTDHDLFADEVINSMELLELIMYLEVEFELYVDQELMSADNFWTVDQIVKTFLSNRG